MAKNVRWHYFCLHLPILEIVLVRSRNNNVVDLEHHSAQLRRQLELLLLANERINDKGVLHVVVAAAHAVHAQLASLRRAGLDLLALNLGQRRDGVQTAVLGQRHGNGVEGFRKGAHRVLLEAGRLTSRILNSQRAGNLGGAATVDDAVVADQVSYDAEGIVEGSLRFVDKLISR